MSEFIGPALPDHLLKKKRQRKDENDNDDADDKDACYGPKRFQQDDESPVERASPRRRSQTEAMIIGPVLPGSGNEKGTLKEDRPPFTDHVTQFHVPGIKLTDMTVEPVSYGPALPPGFIASGESDGDESEITKEQDEVIGPLPTVPPSDNIHQIRHDINTRSHLMKERLTTKDIVVAEKPQREEWMMELPPEIKSIGLGARKFQTKYTETGDRSVWTRMPGEEPKEPEKKNPIDRNEYIQSMRNQQIAREVEDYNKKNRSESLVQLHQKKKASESKGRTEERKPFNRETDLALPKNLMTASKQKKLIKDSESSLDRKFTRGKASFL